MIIFKCPSLNCFCDWEGPCEELEQHFEDYHTDLLIYRAGYIPLLQEEPINFILVHRAQLFLVQLIPQHAWIKVRVRQPPPASSTSYVFTVQNASNPDVVFSSTDSSEGYHAVHKKDGGIEVDMNMVRMVTGQGDIVGAIVFQNLPAANGVKLRRKVSRKGSSLRGDRDTAVFKRDSLRRRSAVHYVRMLSYRSGTASVNMDAIIDELKELSDSDSSDVVDLITSFDDADITEDFTRVVLDYIKSQKLRRRSSMEPLEMVEYDSKEVQDKCREEVETRLSQFQARVTTTSEELNEILQKKEDELMTKLSMITCSNCSRYMNPPIFVCKRGHSVCFYCQSDICNNCGDRITDISNSDLEDISRSIPHPCRYQNQGCPKSVLYSGIHAHEIQCQYHQYNCPVLNCHNLGKLSFNSMTRHLKTSHPSLYVADDSRCVPFVKDTAFFMVNPFVGIFYCTSSMTTSTADWTVYFCGDNQMYFTCLVHMTGKRAEEKFFLTRRDKVWQRSVTLKEIKDLKLKSKTALLHISCFN